MKISKNEKNISEFFYSFLKCTSNFANFEKKDDSHSLSISEITNCERGD